MEMAGVWSRVSLLDDKEDSLSLVDNQRLVVPKALQKTILTDFHQRTHRRPEMTKKTLRMIYFWPLMREMMDDECKSCDPCVVKSPSRPEEPFVAKEEDNIMKLKPMEKISANIFYMEGKKPHLFVIDKFSGYIMWKPLRGETTDHMPW